MKIYSLDEVKWLVTSNNTHWSIKQAVSSPWNREEYTHMYYFLQWLQNISENYRRSNRCLISENGLVIFK